MPVNLINTKLYVNYKQDQLAIESTKFKLNVTIANNCQFNEVQFKISLLFHGVN